MPRLPAVCTDCDVIYPSPLHADRPDGDIDFAVPAPCPDCGSGGRVPAEVLRRLTGIVELLRGLDVESGELGEALEEAAAICREADDREEAVPEVLRSVPRLGRLAGLLPGETPAQMAVFTRVVRALAEEVVAEAADGRGEEPTEVAEGAGEGTGAPEDSPDPEPALEVASRALARLYDRDVPVAAGPPEEEERARRRLRETGRNDPCPCDSGEKYKACHWVEDQRVTRV